MVGFGFGPGRVLQERRHPAPAQQLPCCCDNIKTGAGGPGCEDVLPALEEYVERERRGEFTVMTRKLIVRAKGASEATTRRTR